MKEKRYRDISSRYCPFLMAFLCLTVVILSSCRKEKSTVESVQNDKIISNREPLWKDDQRITLRLIQKIGGVDTEKEEYFFNRNFDMVQDSRGNKYVLSHGDSKVRKFDKEWNYVLSFVKAGQGPGEVERSMCLEIDSLDNLYILDMGKARAVKYSPDGVYLKDIKFPGRCLAMMVLNSGRYVVDAKDFSQKDNSTIMAVMDPEEETIKRFAFAKDYGDSFLTMSANEVFFTHDKRDNIYMAFENQNRMEKYSPAGDLIWRVEIFVDYTITNKMSLQYGEMWPDLTYVHTDIIPDSKERLWVTTFRSKLQNPASRAASLRDPSKLEFRIYGQDGTWLGRIPVPVSHHKTRIYGNHLYLIDPYFEACIYEYEIIEGELSKGVEI
jgi:hypothetical protein